MEFPLYRKYPNNKSYFKVLSHDEFEEVLFIGRKGFYTKVKAKILPDRNLIFDMIGAKANWVVIMKEEYEDALCRING